MRQYRRGDAANRFEQLLELPELKRRNTCWGERARVVAIGIRLKILKRIRRRRLTLNERLHGVFGAGILYDGGRRILHLRCRLRGGVRSEHSSGLTYRN